MKNFILGVFVGSLLLILGAMAYLRLGFAEVRADLPPSKFETQFMRASVHASVHRKAREATNPVTASDESLVAGGKLYANNCAGCHGNLGGSEDTGESLFPPIPNSRRSARPTPRPRFSGFPNTVSDERVCSPMENGSATRTCGPWRGSSSEFVSCRPRFKPRLHRRKNPQNSRRIVCGKLGPDLQGLLLDKEGGEA